MHTCEWPLSSAIYLRGTLCCLLVSTYDPWGCRGQAFQGPFHSSVGMKHGSARCIIIFGHIPTSFDGSEVVMTLNVKRLAVEFLFLLLFLLLSFRLLLLFSFLAFSTFPFHCFFFFLS